MIEERDWPLIDRYLAGECTPVEAADLEGRMRSDAALRALVDGARGATASAWQPDAARAWERVRTRAITSDAPTREFPAWRRAVAPPAWRRAVAHPAWKNPAWRIAAALVVAVGGAALAWGVLGRGGTPTRPVAFQQIETRAGQRLMATLPDGSRVLLAPETRLRFPAVMRGRVRSVSLEGEAMFAVAHDAAHPFVVRAGSAEVRVLGTQFVMTARPGERPLQVVVSEGRVLLRAGGPGATGEAILGRGDLGRVAAGGQVEVRHGVDLDRELDWTRGRLVFEDALVTDAFARLGHWYGVRLIAGDSTLAHERFSGTIEMMPLPELLQTLTLALDARSERHGDAVKFFAQSPSRPGGD